MLITNKFILYFSIFFFFFNEPLSESALCGVIKSTVPLCELLSLQKKVSVLAGS